MPDEPKFELTKDPAFVQMTQTMQGIMTLLRTQGATLQQLQTNATSQTARTGKVEDDDDEEDEETDVNALSQADFHKFVMKNIGTMLDEKLGGMKTALDGAVGEVRRSDLSKQIDQMRKDHKDFDDWNQEMTALSKENPTLSLSRLYKLARSESPEKAKELDGKYADPKDDKDKPDEGLTLFGGFRPTTKTPSGGEEGKDAPKKTIDEALEAGWNEIVSKVPALAKMEDTLD